MPQASKPFDLAGALAVIGQLDLAPIRRKIADPHDGYGWTEEHADDIEKAYRRLLTLRAMYPALPLAPTPDIDRFWHAHILDTRKYAQDCAAIFGEFLHHNPHLGLCNDLPDLQRAAATLRDLYEREFGESMPADAAWCGVDPVGEPQAAPVGYEAAWCGVEPVHMEAAWCGVEPVQALTTH